MNLEADEIWSGSHLCGKFGFEEVKWKIKKSDEKLFKTGKCPYCHKERN